MELEIVPEPSEEERAAIEAALRPLLEPAGESTWVRAALDEGAEGDEAS